MRSRLTCDMSTDGRPQDSNTFKSKPPDALYDGPISVSSLDVYLLPAIPCSLSSIVGLPGVSEPKEQAMSTGNRDCKGAVSGALHEHRHYRNVTIWTRVFSASANTGLETCEIKQCCGSIS